MEHLAAAKKQFSILGLGIFAFLGIGTLIQLLLIAVINTFLPQWLEYPWSFWLVTFAPIYLIAFPLSLLILRKAPPKALPRRSLKPREILILAMISVFMMYAGNLFGTVITTLLQAVSGQTIGNPILSYAMDTAFLPKVLFLAILAPVIEEYVFRKQLIDRMHPYGEKTAVIVSALMFGLFHGNLAQLFYAFTLGLVFGFVYLKTGKLRYSIGLHMLINCMGSVVAPLFLEKIPLMDTAAPTQVTPWTIAFSVYTFLLLGSVIAGLILFIRHRKVTFSEAESELPKDHRFRTIYLNAGMLLFLLGCFAMIALNSILA